MNWEALGAIAEALGAVGVIATLVYLASQIRQNSREIVDTRTQSIMELMIQTRSELAEGRMAEIQVKVDAQDPLTAEEEIRYRAHRAHSLNIWETYHLASRAGKISSDLDALMAKRLEYGFVKDNPASQKNRDLWQQSRIYFTQEFQDYVDQIIRRSDEATG
jgi:hypothetical protein